ncbi:hypothetical protein A4X13_0g4261 [Tilletia indica]|uniref:Uncharacterized protein n=1 Tax=Tilletia indica TaxID=43049 RepID=A0A177TAV1_9BASI|nr:hypothetical protein A4X13_0g4261 [Tilletia indica]
MVSTAVERALGLGEIWEVIVNAADLADLVTLRQVCRRANAAAERRDFRRLLFKADRHSYAPGLIRKIQSLRHVRTLRFDRPSLFNLQCLLKAMEATDEGRLERVDLFLSALDLVPKLVKLSKAHPILRRKLRTLQIPGQAIWDHSNFQGSEAIKWWTALAQLLDRRAEDDLPLQALMISPGRDGYGLYWPDQITNGPSSLFYGVLENVVAPHLEALVITIGRRDSQAPVAQNSTTFKRISQIAFPKLRKLNINLVDIDFSEFERQDFDYLLHNAPEIEELYLVGSMLYPTRLRTYLPKLRHLRIRMQFDPDRTEHASSVREEVVAFALLHRSQLRTLSLDAVRQHRHRAGLGIGGPLHQASEWANDELDAAEFPLLRGLGPGIAMRGRTALRMGSISLKYGDEVKDKDWVSRFAELGRSTDLGQLTVLKLECWEPTRIEPALEELVRLHRSGAFPNLRELQLDQGLRTTQMERTMDHSAIWKLLKVLAPVSTLQVLWIPLRGYQVEKFVSDRNLTLEEEATSTPFSIPPRLELVVQRTTFYRVLRLSSAATAIGEGGLPPRRTIRLDPVNRRHVPIHHGSDVWPELQLVDFCSGVFENTSTNSFLDASIMEHINVEAPVIRSFAR